MPATLQTCPQVSPAQVHITQRVSLHLGEPQCPNLSLISGLTALKNKGNLGEDDKKNRGLLWHHGCLDFFLLSKVASDLTLRYPPHPPSSPLVRHRAPLQDFRGSLQEQLERDQGQRGLRGDRPTRERPRLARCSGRKRQARDFNGNIGRWSQIWAERVCNLYDHRKRAETEISFVHVS